MTCVVGVVQDGRVYMGADSAETGVHDLMLRSDQQVFRAGRVLIGFSGSFRAGDLLHFTIELPQPPDATMTSGQAVETTLHKFMVQEFVTKVQKGFQESGFASRDKDTGQERGGWFMVGCSGHLFTIAADYRVVEACDGYDALGAGSGAALGALYATRGEDAVQRVCKALGAAAGLTGAVRPPFHVWCLETSGTCTESHGISPTLGAA